MQCPLSLAGCDKGPGTLKYKLILPQNPHPQDTHSWAERLVPASSYKQGLIGEGL